MKKYQLLFSLGCFVMLGIVISSCNKEYDRILVTKDFKDTATVAFGNPKVLYIIADGARGISVRDANTPNIQSLLPHAIYSWVSVSDRDSNARVSNWTDMLTGVKKTKHKVLETSFANNNLAKFPLIFKRIKQNNAAVKMISFTSSQLFKDSLTVGADQSTLLSSDNEVKKAVVNNLAIDSASLIVAHFTEIDKAGAQYGYDNSFIGYKTSIETFDGYVGDMLKAMHARPNYAKENWLVVVTSSTGGHYNLPATQNDNTIFSNTDANTFVIYNNPKYNQKVITKPYTGNRYLGSAVRLFGRDNAVKATVDYADAFNFSETTQFTIELKVKKNPGPNNNYIQNYPSILGKMSEWSSNKPESAKGWAIFLEEQFWQISVRGSNNNLGQTRGSDLGHGIWNSIAVKCEIRNNRRYLRTYTDGKYFGEMDVTGWGGFSTEAPLTLGYLQGNGHGEPDVSISDIRIWRTAIPDGTIQEFACETNIDQNHPFYNYLAGYWPGIDGQGNIIKDHGPLNYDFKLQGNYEWKQFNDLICPPSASDLSLLIPQNADIPAQILSWLHIAQLESWQLDGRVWLE